MGDSVSLRWASGPRLSFCIVDPPASHGCTFDRSSLFYLGSAPPGKIQSLNPSVPRTPTQFLSQMSPTPLPHLPCVTFLSLLCGVSQCILSPPAPLKDSRSLKPFRVHPGTTPSPQHTHTCSVPIPRTPYIGEIITLPETSPGVPRIAPAAPSSRTIGSSGPSPCRRSKPPSPWPLFTRTRAS